jgi:hypothetical protein
LLVIPIDQVGSDLREWAQTLKTEVRLWIVRKLVECGNADNVIYEIPEEYRPVLDTSPDSEVLSSGYKYYDVTIADLLASVLLKPDETLVMFYKPRGGERKQYQAKILPNASIEVLGKTFSAPSYAALLCLQTSGSDRETVNGWTSWKNAKGETLADLRDEFLRTASGEETGSK